MIVEDTKDLVETADLFCANYTKFNKLDFLCCKV